MKPIHHKLLVIRALVLTCTAVVGLLAIHAPASAQQKKTIAVAVKLAGDPWWNRMEEGLKASSS